MKEIRVLICGANGAMGKTLAGCIAESDGICVSCGYDAITAGGASFPVYGDLSEIKEPVDAAIDFSHRSATKAVTDWCVKNKTPLVSAVTGLDDEEEAYLKSASENIPVFRSANFSYGVSVLGKLVREAAKLLGDGYDIELIEAHHNKKADAPSGTAKKLLNIVSEAGGGGYEYKYGREGASCKRSKNEIGVHAIRGGAIAGEHTLMFAGEGEVITIKHTALSKSVFACGAIKAALYLADKPNGFYDMDGMISGK